jgi:DNA processing protein
MTETQAWLLFHRISGMGPKRMMALYSHFGSLEKAWDANLLELMQIEGIGKDVALKILGGRQMLDLGKILSELEKNNCWAIAYPDPEYPDSLRQLCDPPAILYGRGEFPLLERAVALVGTRKASPYGLSVARTLARDLAALDVVVVSGMAKGVDAAAHQGSLDGGGKTLAVLGCGPDVVYPRESTSLYRHILQDGCVVSEYPPGTAPEARHFPARNRIISALSAATVVVEAPLKSGALITVDFALEQGKEVMAVPGEIGRPLSEGPHHLISQGAALVTSANDICQILNWDMKPAPLEISPEEALIYETIGNTPVHVDHVIRETKMEPAVVIGALVVLELKTLVTQLPGQHYVRHPLHREKR